MVAEPDGDGGTDAVKRAERVRAALVKAGCKTAAAAGIAPAAKSDDEADDSLAGRFAALTETEQKRRVQRWVDGSDADAVRASHTLTTTRKLKLSFPLH